ncbi:ATP-binding cassette subfamily C protein CydD [Phyllobacterium sp. 1468]|uniref:thiol reductant ABC exporter subunit CydD n=1 Tax=Phyllobacterium sp. 1468 TaxID=2817759 RepID=UPI00286423F0|nr:thiol reductant ABC exporter subunit CydD [Phyllobacterium sp. 1468]MDR6634686.1 ATP-binding cassette subfamily C protein CydD [Phyllobacterium sp. 1468]
MAPAAHSSSIALRTQSGFADDSAAVRTTSSNVAEKSASSRHAARAERAAPIVLVLAPLLWLPQALLLATGVGDIVAGKGMASIHWLVLGVVVIGMFRTLLDAVGSRLAFRAARAVLSGKRDKAVAALARRSPLDVNRAASGFAASVLAEQAEAIVPYLSRFRPARLKATIVPVAIMLCVLPLSWAVAIVLLISAPLIPVFMALIGWRAKAASEKQLVEMGGMNAFLLDRLRGLATIRSLDAVDLTAHRLRDNAQSLRMRTMAVLKIAFLSSAVLELFAALGVAMVAVYVGFHLLGQLNFGAWGARLSLTEGLFILLLAPAFFEPLRELSAVWHDRAAGGAALEALDALSSGGVVMPGAGKGATHTTAVHAGVPGVRVEEMTFHHQGNSPAVFDRFSLDVLPAEHIAVLGSSGSGKSTLLALIAGLAPQESGRIAIGNVPLTLATAAELRKGIAWVGQKPHIFAGTVADNVALGRPEIGSDEVGTALRKAALQDVANAHANAPIGEGGSGLSGGEVLRLALARAAANRDAGLILADEPTAHLDAITANEIMDILLRTAAGKTLIVATHDPVLARRMDRVVILPSKTSQEGV